MGVDERYTLPYEAGQLKANAASEAEKIAATMYPDHIKTRQQLEQYAASYCARWMEDPRSRWDRGSGISIPFTHKKLTNDPDTLRLIFIGSFVSQYIKTVERNGGKVSDASVPQAPTLQPPTPSNIAMLEGAKITLMSVEHYADACVYLLRIDDPNYIEPYEQELELRLGEVIEPPTTSSYGASSGTTASADYVVPTPQYGSKTPQKPRRVTSSYFRKPQ